MKLKGYDVVLKYIQFLAGDNPTNEAERDKLYKNACESLEVDNIEIDFYNIEKKLKIFGSVEQLAEWACLDSLDKQYKSYGALNTDYSYYPSIQKQFPEYKDYVKKQLIDLRNEFEEVDKLRTQVNKKNEELENGAPYYWGHVHLYNSTVSSINYRLSRMQSIYELPCEACLKLITDEYRNCVKCIDELIFKLNGLIYLTSKKFGKLWDEIKKEPIDMNWIDLPQNIYDPRVKEIIGEHSQKFFDFFKLLEPYTLVRVGPTFVEFSPRGNVLMDDITEFFKGLLYKVTVNMSNQLFPNGLQYTIPTSILVEWDEKQY